MIWKLLLKADLFFPPNFAVDFLAAMEISRKNSLIYVITKLGLLFVYVITTGSTEDVSMVDENDEGSVGQPLLLESSASAPSVSVLASSHGVAVDQTPHLQPGSIHVDRTGNKEIVQYKCACGKSCQITGNGESFDYKCACGKGFQIRLT